MTGGCLDVCCLIAGLTPGITGGLGEALASRAVPNVFMSGGRKIRNAHAYE